jgi:hypothetical protein
VIVEQPIKFYKTNFANAFKQGKLDLEMYEEAKQIVQETEASKEEQQNGWYVVTHNK